MKNISFFLLFITFISCKNNTQQQFFSSESNLKDIKITSIQLDSFYLDRIDASYVGNMGIVNDSLYFIDSKFCWLFLFNKEGHFIERKLGQGKGPKELPTNEICGHGNFQNGWLFIGSGNDCHIYDKGFNLIQSYLINKGRRDTILSYKLPAIYTLSYNNLIIKQYGHSLYMNIYSEAPRLNYFENPQSYFENSKTLFQINLSTGNVTNLLGEYHGIYKKHGESARLYSNVNYDINPNNGDFYVSYEADSLIYCYDKNYQIKSSFGSQGENMNIKYPSFPLKEFINKYYTERMLHAHYTGLTYLPQANLLIRTYSKGAEYSQDGMQLYEDQTLIGDLNVPKKMKIIGYIKPYIYAYCGIDELNEQIKLYKLFYEK